MKKYKIFSSILILLIICFGQTMQAASHSTKINIQASTSEIHNPKQEKKIKRFERKQKRKERRNIRWGNLALGVAILQLVLFITVVVLTATAFWVTVLFGWTIWFVVWTPSMIFAIIAMIASDKNEDKKERRKSVIAFFLGLVPIVYGAVRVLEFASGL